MEIVKLVYKDFETVDDKIDILKIALRNIVF